MAHYTLMVTFNKERAKDHKMAASYIRNRLGKIHVSDGCPELSHKYFKITADEFGIVWTEDDLIKEIYEKYLKACEGRFGHKMTYKETDKMLTSGYPPCVDLEDERISPDFIGRKWLAKLDCHW